jgi:uncharacterized PurR-regulated membrane protein YhhQ (DUF165 family)
MRTRLTRALGLAARLVRFAITPALVALTIFLIAEHALPIIVACLAVLAIVTTAFLVPAKWEKPRAALTGSIIFGTVTAAGDSAHHGGELDARKAVVSGAIFAVVLLFILWVAEEDEPDQPPQDPQEERQSPRPLR